MTGGVSHVDSFDPKPKLFADDGKTVAVDNWQGKPGQVQRYLKKPQWDVQAGRQERHRGQRPVPARRASVWTTCA